MDQIFRVMTDTATIAIFDEGLRRDPLASGLDWWALPLNEVPEVARREAALVSLGADGVYVVRMTDGELTDVERAYAGEVVRGLGFIATSGRVAVGPGEALPEPGSASTFPDESCAVLEIDPGAYQVDAYSINWFDSPRWWRDGRVVRDEAPAEIVLVVRPRTLTLPPLVQEPRLWMLGNSWVFPDEPREVGPAPGMLLVTTVRKGPNGLSLKDCGPSQYAATLSDYSAVRWKDRIRFRVTSVDHAARTLVGEFIEKIPPEPAYE